MNHFEFDQYFSFQLYSDETGFSKPNVKMFEMVYNQIGKNKIVNKLEVLHIGDNKVADYNGAINFGFDALLI
jgi:putative hydrolase of the HAD superfamily